MTQITVHLFHLPVGCSVVIILIVEVLIGVLDDDDDDVDALLLFICSMNLLPEVCSTTPNFTCPTNESFPTWFCKPKNKQYPSQ